MAFIQPGKGLILDFTLSSPNGTTYNLLPFVNVMRIFE